MTKFGPQALAQIREVVRRVLSEPRNANPGGQIYVEPYQRPQVYLAKTTTTHTSMSNKPIRFCNGPHPSTSFSSTDTVEAFNYFADIAEDQFIFVTRCLGEWVLLQGDPCAT